MSVLSDEKYLEMAHRMATTYRHDAGGPGRHHYGFHRHTLLDFARAVADAAIAADRAARAEPVGWQFFHEGRWVNGMETNNHRANTEAAGIPVRDVFAAAPAAPVVPEYDRNAYEELRSIIDGGSESMTHADAVEWCKRHADADWTPVKPAAPVVPNEEGKHCGDPDCVPCRDPAEPAAQVVPECPFPCGWRKLYELMMRDAAWVSSQLQAYPDEPLPEHLPQIVFVNHDRALRVVRAMLAAPAGEQVGLTDAALSALRDAATSLETISRLAGRKTYGRPPIETFMDSFADVRAYAASRASVARTAIAAHEAKKGGAS